MATISTPPSPAPSPTPSTLSLPLVSDSPLPLIVVGFLVIAFIVVLVQTYSFWRRRRRPVLPSYSSPNSNSTPANIPVSSPNSNSTPANIPVSSPNFNTPGLPAAIIMTIPFSKYTRESNAQECAVCLLELEENDYVRTLPVCHHVYHADCIDEWLRSSGTCPICRARILRPESS